MAAFQCNNCNVTFGRRADFNRHNRRFHSGLPIYHECIICQEHFRTLHALAIHRRTHIPNEDYYVHRNALNSTCTIYRRILPDHYKTTEDIIQSDLEQIKRVLTFELEEKNVVKVGLNVQVNFKKITDDEMSINFTARSTSVKLIKFDSKEDYILKSFAEIQNRLDEFQQNGSDWVVDNLVLINIEFGKCQELSGSCNAPVGLKWKKQLSKLNIVDDGSNDCFLKAIAFHFIRTENRKKIYNFIETYINYEEQDLPMKVSNIKKFQANNDNLDCNINLVGLSEDNSIYPIFCGGAINNSNQITLLLLTTKTKIGKNVLNHFLHVEDIGRFVRRQYTSKNGTYTYEKVNICLNCFNRFGKKTSLIRHQETCLTGTPQKLVVAEEENKILKFDKPLNKFLSSFVGFYDFETLSKKVKHRCKKCRVRQLDCEHSTKYKTVQVPVSYAILLLDWENEIVYFNSYIGKKVISKFIDEIVHVGDLIKDRFDKFEPIQMSESDELYFNVTQTCHICEKEIAEDDAFDNNFKVRDHSHLTGKFLGPAHNTCNLKRTEKNKHTVLYAHNSSGFDTHLILSELPKHENVYKIKALPKNMEQFRCIEINKLCLYDSFQLLPDSLDKLVNNLKKSNHSFDILKQSNLAKNDVQFEMLTRKGVFPYEYASSLEKLQNSSYPDKQAFSSLLTNSEVDDTNYDFGKYFYQEFKCENLADYCLIYNKIDVLLLAEIVIQFRKMIYDEFTLDACKYISLPSLSYDCFLKSSKVEIELFTDIDMFQFVKRGIRGGVSYIAERHFEKNLTKAENVIDISDSQSALYIDANNLYGYAMSQSLPHKDFKWLSAREITAINWLTTTSDADTGYILEVDLHYPENLHDSHASYPLAPERIDIDYHMLSPYNKICKQVLEGKNKHKSTKLTCTFNDRKKYVIHYNNLRLYLQLGMKLTKIHTVLSFTQSPFMNSYITNCTEKRKNSKSDCFKNLYKLLNNSCFGKLMENVCKYTNVELTQSKKKACKLLSDPRCTGFRIINKDLIAIFRQRSTVYLRQPIAAGLTVLELSKYFMYEQYYKNIKPTLGNECRVLMTDTDSFILACSNTSKECLTKLGSYMDFSNYNSEHDSHSEKNKNALGFWKDEMKGEEIIEFVGVRSKVYCLKTDQIFSSKCKGIKKSYKKNISFDLFKKAIFNISEVKINQFCLRSKNHIISLVEQDRVAFRSLDDKRYLLDCGLHSVPYGHSRYVINSVCETCSFPCDIE